MSDIGMIKGGGVACLEALKWQTGRRRGNTPDLSESRDLSENYSGGGTE